MEFSSDLPHGPKAIARYLASGQNVSMNVSREADRAFRFDLKRVDPKLWAKLDAELQKDFYRRLREKPAELWRFREVTTPSSSRIIHQLFGH